MNNDEFNMLSTTHEKLDILFNMMTQNVKTQSTIINSLTTILNTLKSAQEEGEPSKAPDTILIDILTRVEAIEDILKKKV